MSPAYEPRTAHTLRPRMHRRSSLVMSLLGLTACALLCASSSSIASGTELSAELAASSALRAAAVSGVAPVLVPPSAMRVNPGETADQVLHATDSDGDPLTFSKAFGPSYLTVTTTDPGSGSGTGNIHLAPPIPTDIGPTSGGVAVGDGVFLDQQSFSIVISTTPPVLEQPGDMWVAEGGSADQTLMATDADGDPLTFRLVSGPTYATVTTMDPGAGVASGSVRLAPVEGDAGISTADVGASDGIAEDVKRFEITVARLNHKPALDSLLPMVVAPLTEEFQSLHASDPDLDPLTFYLAGDPAYVTVSTTSSTGGSATGVVRLAPTFDDIGPATAELGVTDGSLTDTRQFSIQVVPASSGGTCAPAGVMQEPTLRRVPEPRFTSGFRAFDASLAPQSFELDDIDGDGVEDVVSASNDCGVVILFGLPDGTFGRSVRYDTGGTGARAVAVADFDGDGIKDLAVPNQWQNTFAVLFGEGGGAFRSPVLYTTGARPVHIAARYEAVGSRPCYTAIVDLDRDGALDVATINEYSNSVSVLLGNGDGTFRPQTQYATGTDPRSVEVGDLNGDGVLDFAVPNFDGTVSTLLGNGDGTFAPRRDVEAGQFPWSVALGDVNSDGILDGVVANVGSSTCTVLLGRGDGTFTRHADFPGGWLARYAELADVNRDGKLDLLLVSEGGNTLTVHPGKGDGTFGDHRAAAVGSHPLGLALGDLNRDGRLDLVTTIIDTPDLTFRMGRADGGLDPATSVFVGGETSEIHEADFNRDGMIDLAALLLQGNGIVTLRGIGDGSFGPAAVVPVEGQPGDFNVADVTGDGIPDLVLVDRAGGRLAIHAGRGDGSFAAPVPVGVGAHPSTVALGDLDGDGLLDAVTGNGVESSVSILRGQGGSLALIAVLPTGRFAFDVGLEDLDRDGHLDLVVVGDDGLHSLRGRGDGTFEAARAAPTLGRGGGIVIGDLNGDSIPDVATVGSNFVSVFPGAGDGSFDPYIAFGTGVGPGGLALGDLNGDGRPDLITADHTDNAVGLLLNEGAARPNRPPAARAGGPYVGTARIPLEFDGSRSADPDGDPLRFAWDFGDGRTGLGVTPLHTYGASGDYHVALTVSDGTLAGVDSTMARIVAVLEARAFAAPENRTVRLFASRPSACIQLEPVGGDFALADVNLATVRLRSAGTGVIEEIAALSGKLGIARDRDRNGVPELSACFASEDVRELFQSVTGRVQVDVTLDGVLESGARFVAAFSLEVQGVGGYPAVAVAPNPLNPSAKISVVTSRPGRMVLWLFDAQGRLVRVVLNEPMAAPGVHEAHIGEGRGGTPLPSGIYFYRIETADGAATGRVAILK
ncbi:MAG: PKD domain-containing protein [Candidatus Eisenbacteria bacterium]|uniref:PKD domain-containing protein n=1 Tax=Eiseniibacteriota bacterium TaxID=2212470 RepID=A0A538SS10_UNCEI|nr:MAG: PKD domain-containing protein [Candidatus Eisenbacteria bacterium]